MYVLEVRMTCFKYVLQVQLSIRNKSYILQVPTSNTYFKYLLQVGKKPWVLTQSVKDWAVLTSYIYDLT